MVSKAAALSLALLAAMSGCDTQEAEDPAEAAAPAPPPPQETAMTEEIKSAAETGEVSVPGVRLTWTRADAVVQYKLLYEAPNACYSAGPLTAAVTGPAVKIAAEVAVSGGICAQVITVISFEGEVTGVTGPFTLTATVTDQKSGEAVTLTAP